MESQVTNSLIIVPYFLLKSKINQGKLKDKSEHAESSSESSPDSSKYLTVESKSVKKRSKSEGQRTMMGFFFGSTKIGIEPGILCTYIS